MRLGFFGNVANDAYIFAKLLRDRGYDAELILDPHDQFAFSQPIWEDCDFTLDKEQLTGETIDRDFWIKKTRELDWRNPPWVREVGDKSVSKRQIAGRSFMHPKLTIRAIINAGRSGPAVKFALRNMHISKSLSNYDLLLVYGFGPIYASLSAAPYVFVPFGGDVTIDPSRTDFLGELQLNAIKRARKIMVGDPDFIGHLKKIGLNDAWVYFPFPTDPVKYAPASSEQDKSTVLSMLPELAKGRFIFFMPSRQDFYWKGTDRALNAFVRLCKERDDAVLITPSWGEDTAKAMEITSTTRGKQRVIFLPYALSKPMLIRFFRASNIVLDQFVLGSYGTSMIEAMACGKAVLTHVDHEKYRPYLREIPPNLECGTESEILERMRWALDHSDLLDELGAKSRRWAITEHFERSLEVAQGVLREFQES